MLAYLDHAATSPSLPETAEAMIPWLTGLPGNPSGSHAVARRARRAVEEARGSLAELLGAAPGEVVLTGGGTEADFLAVRGVIEARRRSGRPSGTVVISAIEHAAVREAAAGAGVPVREVPSGRDGVVDLDALADAVDPGVSVVSVMLVNNEVGTVQPLAAISDLVRRRAPGALLHTDAVQAFPWMDLRTAASCADLVAVSAHKWGGPQGVGALVVRDGAPFAGVTVGGGQERERRGGTHNVAGIVGAAASARVADAGRAAASVAVADRRDRLVTGLLASIPGAVATVPAGVGVAPGFAHVCIEGVESEALLVLLDEAGVCASAGSACASGALHASHVLLAMGVPEERALGSLRLTLGPGTTDAEVDLALEVVPAAVARLRDVPGHSDLPGHGPAPAGVGSSSGPWSAVGATRGRR